ncbi:ribonuclease Z [Candidatus Micrarchaeota archaeon]|nr:ribonuclease Z [Candidatus Micrarchaeota archaeon]
MIRVICLGSSASLPSSKHVPSCFAVKYGGVFLFDCCEGAQRQMMKYGANYGSIDCVFITHLHADHFLGVFGLVQTMGLNGRKEELKIFGPKGIKSFLESVFSLKPLQPAFPIVVKEVSSGVVFENKLFSVKAFPVKHSTNALGYALEEHAKIKFFEDKARALGVEGKLFGELLEKKSIKIGRKTIKLEQVTFEEKGKKIVFSGDSMYCDSLVEAAGGADLFVCDSSFSDSEKELALEKKHLTALQAAKIAKKAKVKKLLLTHFSHRYSDRSILVKEAKQEFSNVLSAQEGMELLV